MPYIEVKITPFLNEQQKDDLQKKLTNAVSSAFAKPQAYIMAGIEDGKSLYMGAKQIEKGAYIAIRLLGAASRSSCQSLTEEICRILQNDYAISPAFVYVTYHPVDLWGWNGSLF